MASFLAAIITGHPLTPVGGLQRITAKRAPVWHTTNFNGAYLKQFVVGNVIYGIVYQGIFMESLRIVEVLRKNGECRVNYCLKECNFVRNGRFCCVFVPDRFKKSNINNSFSFVSFLHLKIRIYQI